MLDTEHLAYYSLSMARRYLHHAGTRFNRTEPLTGAVVINHTPFKFNSPHTGGLASQGPSDRGLNHRTGELKLRDKLNRLAPNYASCVALCGRARFSYPIRG